MTDQDVAQEPIETDADTEAAEQGEAAGDNTPQAAPNANGEAALTEEMLREMLAGETPRVAVDEAAGDEDEEDRIMRNAWPVVRENTVTPVDTTAFGVVNRSPDAHLSVRHFRCPAVRRDAKGHARC